MKRPYTELKVEEFFGLDPKKTTEKTVIETDYGILVNLAQMICDDIASKAFVAGRSKISWKQFEKDNL